MNTELNKPNLNHLRELRKELIDHAKLYLKEQSKTRKLLKEVWNQDELTVLELTERTKLPSELVFWNVVAMRKFGKVQEVGIKGSYPTYKLLEKK